MKALIRYIVKPLAIVLCVLFIYAVAMFSLSKIVIQKTGPTIPDVAIYVMTNGIHTDIVVPTVTEQIDWSKEVKYSDTKSADSSYKFLAFGWGDKKFYLETPQFSDLKLSVALGAIAGINESAIHATYYKNIYENVQCFKINLSKEQYSQLINYLKSSFKKDENGNVIKINVKNTYENTDAFYEANGSYQIYYTCNTWANNALKASGQKHCLWTLLDSPIFSAYE